MGLSATLVKRVPKNAGNQRATASIPDYLLLLANTFPLESHS